MGGKNSKISPTGVDQGALVSILQALRNRLLGAPGLTFGSGSPELLRVNPANTDDDFDFCINGVAYRKAGADDIAASISGTAITATQSTRFRVEIDVDGAITSKQGNIDTVLGNCKYPERSANKATIGTISVENYAFTPGTTTLDAAAVTFTDGDPDLGTDRLEA
ncbi:MAG TPA: hypothetical protein DCQ64_18610 [Candidatus Rokubacteria bacterium]|nr:hypothetical protein [Candidatus Rokubacteria bacterium]